MMRPFTLIESFSILNNYYFHRKEEQKASLKAYMVRFSVDSEEYLLKEIFKQQILQVCIASVRRFTFEKLKKVEPVLIWELAEGLQICTTLSMQKPFLLCLGE
jgi:hypothetical protein